VASLSTGDIPRRARPRPRPVSWQRAARASCCCRDGRGRSPTARAQRHLDAKPVKGGTLVFGVDAEEQGFNPSTSSSTRSGFMYAARSSTRSPSSPRTVGGRLPGTVGHLQCEYTSWTITLRPNVVFHDGTPCDGRPCCSTSRRRRSIHHRPRVGSGPRQFPADRTRLGRGHLKTPGCRSPTGSPAASAPGRLHDGPGHDQLCERRTDTPSGPGPFKFVEWIPNDHFTANAFPGYWRSVTLPQHDTYKPIVDPNARSEALQSGSIDMMVHRHAPGHRALPRPEKWSYNRRQRPGDRPTGHELRHAQHGRRAVQHPTCAWHGKSLSAEQYSRIIDLSDRTPLDRSVRAGHPVLLLVGLPTQDVSGAKSLVRRSSPDGAAGLVHT